MSRTVLAELRKLAHPVALIMVLIAFAFILTDARTTFHYARLQTPVAVTATAAMQAAAADCSRAAGPVTQQCQQQLADAALNDHFAQNGIALGRVSTALATWPGMLRFVTHQLATGLGWILLAVLLSVHVAGEWSTKTVGATLLAVGSMRRFWVAKILSLWVAMPVLAVVGTSILELLRFTYTTTVGVPNPPLQQGDPSTWHLTALRPDGSWASWGNSLGVLGLASLIWLIMSVAGTTLAGLLRRPWVMLVSSVAASADCSG